jgi:hypothetical protein
MQLHMFSYVSYALSSNRYGFEERSNTISLDSGIIYTPRITQVKSSQFILSKYLYFNFHSIYHTKIKINILVLIILISLSFLFQFITKKITNFITWVSLNPIKKEFFQLLNFLKSTIYFMNEKKININI